ncbi:MAG: hypothetical protein K2X82_17805 [Gemmataceae bacterium]|nr:hypothetical protein [Gemmataceae bacterium]
MGEFLFAVTDRFRVGHGLLVTPGVGHLGDRLRVGMPLALVRPDGTRLDGPAYVASVLHAPNPIDNPFPGFTGLTEQDIPVGTAVWSAG